MSRVEIVNAHIGTPYDLGGRRPGTVDCYGSARYLQKALFGREMPDFAMPGEAGRSAIAAAIGVHPERTRWREVLAPVDGALMTMARNQCGYHIGTWLDLDGGIVVHAIEECGVVADTIVSLEAVGWRKFRFHVPV